MHVSLDLFQSCLNFCYSLKQLDISKIQKGRIIQIYMLREIIIDLSSIFCLRLPLFDETR